MMFHTKYLSEVAFFQEGPGVRKFQFRNEGVKLLNVGNINKGVLDTSTTKLYISEEEAYGKYKHFLVDEGDLLIASSGIVVDNFHNKIAYVKKEHLPLCLNTSTIRFKSLDKNKFNLDYLKFYLKTAHFKNQLRKLITGAAQLNFGPSHLKKIVLPVPPLPDQLHIATILSKAENLIAQRKESIRLLDEFLKSTFLEMFGNNSTNNKEWKKISLIEGCKIKKDVKCGPFGTQLSKSEYQENGIPVWGIPQINSEFKILPKEFVNKDKAIELDEYSVIPYDIVMSRKGNVGKCSLFPKGFSKGIIHSDVLRIRTDFKKVHPVFLLFQLKHSKKIEIQIKGVTKGAIMAGINVGLLKHIIIDQPPIELQFQFAQIVEKTEALKSQYQQSLRELENLYDSLSQRAFKGELRIKQSHSIAQ
jgi:type I restriction enzyme S subunit